MCWRSSAADHFVYFCVHAIVFSSADPIYWFSPFSWTVRSLSLNEWDSSKYQGPIAGPGTPSEESIYTSTFALNTVRACMRA